MRTPQYLLIGLASGKGGGKTTIANYLAEWYDASVYSLATPLKEIVRRSFDLTEGQVYGSQEAKETVDPRYNVSPRWLMTHIGTEGVRAVLGKNFWVRHMLEDIGNDACELAVCDDVRYHNEADGIRMGFSVDGEEDAGKGIIWRLDPRAFMEMPEPTHSSEAEWMSLTADAVIAPPRRDLALAYEMIDAECAKLGLKKRKTPSEFLDPMDIARSEATIRELDDIGEG